MNGITVLQSFPVKGIRFFIRLMSPIRAKLAGRELFATVYTILSFVSGNLIDSVIRSNFLVKV